MDCVGLQKQDIIDISKPESFQVFNATTGKLLTKFTVDKKNYEIGLNYIDEISLLKVIFSINSKTKNITLETFYFGYGCYFYSISDTKRIVFETYKPSEVRIYVDSNSDE